MGCCSSLTGTLAKSKYPFPQRDIAGKTSSDAPAILSGTTDRHCLPSGLGETSKITLLEPMEKQKCLWSNMWHFRGCENAPGLWGGTSLWNASLLLAVCSCYHCLPAESRRAKLYLPKALAGAEPLELLCCLQHWITPEAALHKAKASQPWFTGTIGQMCHQQLGLSSRDSLAYRQHIAPRGRNHPAPTPALPQGSSQLFVGFPHHPLSPWGRNVAGGCWGNHGVNSPDKLKRGPQAQGCQGK